MLRVALSGGIASGKTAVSDTFATLGVPVVDADILSRKAVEPGSCGLAQITARFGAGILQSDGNLDRSALRQIIFNDKNARADLEAIVHPQVRELTQQALQEHEKSGAPYCIVVIPLLTETNQQGSYDHVVIVDVSEETQLARLLQRDNSTELQARKILASQASREQRLAIADDVIENSGTLDALEHKVKTLHLKLLKIAETKSDTQR